MFGIGRFNLTNRTFDFTPIGPVPTGMAGLEVTPDGKDGYTVVTNGTLGNKRCEFWHFDMATNKVMEKAEFPAVRASHSASRPTGRSCTSTAPAMTSRCTTPRRSSTNAPGISVPMPPWPACST
jgi:hypothetical protein